MVETYIPAPHVILDLTKICFALGFATGLKIWHFVFHFTKIYWLCSLSYDPIIAQDKRITVVDALAHPYLDEGRLRYHSCMCTCCYTTSAGMRQYRVDFEPSAAHPFDDLWERKLTSVQQVKGEKFRGIEVREKKPRVPYLFFRSIHILFEVIF